MNKKGKTGVSPTREENYPEWYQQVVKVSDLAERSAVRGCMVIRPWGYRIWEKIRDHLDVQFRKTGTENAYFPLFIPLSYLEREASHVEGFATECAVVTHHRLVKGEDGKLEPAAPLEEPLVVRPTSETIIGETFSKWINSYRDLPVNINQWANIVRWEMRTRLFLRTAEILWQEGHTAHSSEGEAREKSREMLEVYSKFIREELALPLITGTKSESEKFPGAIDTYTMEGMMQDGKALQMGTSHFLGQNFARAFNIEFRDENETQQHAWTTSWGLTTRLIGGMVMVHGDDDGCILPPRIASSHIAIIPLIHKDETRQAILDHCQHLKETLESVHYRGKPLEVKLDTREIRGGEKVWSWIKKGVPIRVEVGMRDIEGGVLSVARRTHPHKEYLKLSSDEFAAKAPELLEGIQSTLYDRALNYQKAKTTEVTSKEAFYDCFKKEKSGFVLCHFSFDPKVEAQLKKDLGVTVRCLPFNEKEPGTCPFTGEKSHQRCLFSKSY